MIGSGWKERPGATSDRLAAELIDAIVSGRVLPGTVLPSQRAMAASAGTSRSTVAAALHELSTFGWVEPRRQARFVARLANAGAQQLNPRQELSDGSPERARVAAPAAEVDRAVDRAHTRLHAHLSGDGRHRGGLESLRQLIAARYTASGLPTVAAQIVVTNGAMGALDVALAATRGPIVVEDPTYHGALELLARRRRRVVGWHHRREWRFDDLAKLIRTRQPALLYVVADSHNPTGHIADDGQREQLASFADSTMIVIDETLRDLHLASEPTHAAHAAAFHPAIVTIGGLSKTIWSGLRVGWLRLPDAGGALLDSMIDLQSVPIFEQLVAIELWDRLDDVIGARRDRLIVQRDAMSDALTAAGFSHQRPAGGLVCWVDLGRPIATAVSSTLNGEGCASAPGPRFSCSGSYLTHLRLPYTAEVGEIERTVDELRRAASGR